MDYSIINEKTDYSTILYQASVFNKHCIVFSPRYRQAHLRAFLHENRSKAALAFNLAYSDIKAAFNYNLKNLNAGQPIIIASHSQGTIHAGRILKDFFEGKNLQIRLVCAYVIVIPIPENYFINIPACKDSLSTGCFVGWRICNRTYTDTAYISKKNLKVL